MIGLQPPYHLKEGLPIPVGPFGTLSDGGLQFALQPDAFPHSGYLPPPLVLGEVHFG
jgi:hypothetical protein